MIFRHHALSLCAAAVLVANAAVSSIDAVTLNATTPLTVNEPASVPVTSPSTAATTTASSGSSTSRTTMIIIVACVAAVFAVVAVVAILKAHKGSKDTTEPTTPTEGGVFNQYTSAEPSPGPSSSTPQTTTTTLKPSIHRPSDAYTDRTTRTTMGSNGRDTLADRENHENRDEDDDVAMLESYAEPRTFTGGSNETFLSVVNFEEDSSTRSLDVDALRGQSDTMLTTASTNSNYTYWRKDSREDDGTMLETDASAWSFTDAQEPPLHATRF